MPQSGQKRIIGIDICRSIAIILAMFSHAIIASKTYTFIDSSSVWPLRFVLQMAPPVFIILFGAMLEIAYRPRFERGEGRTATQRLLVRALQCYLLYVVTLLPLLVTGQASLMYTIRCALMAGATPFGDILKFYAVALALAPLLLQARRKWGLAPLIVISIIVHMAWPWLYRIPAPPEFIGGDALEKVIGFLVGGSFTTVGGPSLLHGMTFVVCGMLIGKLTRAAMSGDLIKALQARRLATGCLIATTLTVLALWNWNAPLETFQALSNLSLRNANHPLYFACGLLATMLAVAVCIYAYDHKSARLGQATMFMGKTSLFTFSLGNVLLYLAPPIATGAAMAWGYGVFLLILLCAQSYYFQAFQLAKPRQESSALARAQRLLGSVTQAQSSLAAWVAIPYARLIAPVRTQPEG